MLFVLIGFAAVLGLAMGSFLNVVIYRVPAGISVASPASACPRCHTPIRKRDNIPVLSWLLLGRKCRDCREPISARYPLVEVATSASFVGVAALRWPGIEVATAAPALLGEIVLLTAFLYLAAISIALALIDLETQRLPDVIVLPSYLVGGILLSAGSVLTARTDQLVFAGIGLVASYLFYLVLILVKPGGMGRGDLKLSGVLGMYLGWMGLGPLLVGTFAPYLLGGIFAIVLMIVSSAGGKTKIPFGPWMLLGAWVGIAFGEPLFAGYLKIVGLAG